MGRRLLLALLVLAVAGGAAWYVWLRDPVRDLREAVGEVDIKADLGVDASDQGVDLSLKSVELVHGEKGRPHWKLTADRARYLQEEGVVEVRDPEIVYYMDRDGGRAELTVNATRGVVRQKEEQARLWDGVQARFEDSLARAAQMDYNGTARTVVLSGDVELDNPKVRLNAKALSLSLDSRKLTATDGVEALIQVTEGGGTEQGETTQ